MIYLIFISVLFKVKFWSENCRSRGFEYSTTTRGGREEKSGSKNPKNLEIKTSSSTKGLISSKLTHLSKPLRKVEKT